ncbi:MAG: insulinase family protein [Holophaga sp.]|nr:insulinase family protein [Holophaga sp.]
MKLLLVLAALVSVSLAAQAPQTFTMESGLTCVLLESHERALIRMELITRWDRSELPAGKEALGGFLAEVLDAGGAGPYNRAAFNRAVDALGMKLGFTARMGAYRWTLAADSRSQEMAMELLVNAVVRPAFDGPLVESERKTALKLAAAASPRERAMGRFLWNLGDAGAVRPPAELGLDRIEYQDLVDFRRRVLRPERSTLMFYGDLNLTQAKQLVLMHLGIWGPADQVPLKGLPPYRSARSGPEPRLLAVLEPGPGAELWAGASRPEGNPAVEALLPILLARTSRSRFGGFAMSFRLPADSHGPLLIKAEVPLRDRDTLVPGFMAALERLRSAGFSPEDLACALLQWKAENSALALHPEALLRETLDGRLNPELARAVQRLTLKEIDQALQAWLDPQRLRFLLVGADAGVLQAADKAGLKPVVIVGPDA